MTHSTVNDVVSAETVAVLTVRKTCGVQTKHLARLPWCSPRRATLKSSVFLFEVCDKEKTPSRRLGVLSFEILLSSGAVSAADDIDDLIKVRF